MSDMTDILAEDWKENPVSNYTVPMHLRNHHIDISKYTLHAINEGFQAHCYLGLQIAVDAVFYLRIAQ